MADEYAVPEVPTVEVMVAGELDFRALVRLADTIDQVVDSATMVNAETFSTQFRQAGGQ